MGGDEIAVGRCGDWVTICFMYAARTGEKSGATRNMQGN